MKREKLNKFYGIGTLGRDMVYAMSAMYLMYYLTDVKGVSVKGLGIITVVMVLLRIFDALNDPVMGYLIDNTKSRFGKFKPWIFGGSIVSAVMTILLFFNPTDNETVYLIYFTIVYLLWGFRVIIMTQANSQVNIRVLELLPKFKIKKMNRWCAV